MAVAICRIGCSRWRYLILIWNYNENVIESRKMNSTTGVAVIVAARNMAQTIIRAVRSAMAQPQTAEVIVVDDASSDDTEALARSADDGTGRLRVIRLDCNIGPAAARNRAISASTAPIIALLDGDDFFLQGRLATMLAHENWDLIADNIAFVRDDLVDRFAPEQVAAFPAEPQVWSLADFIAGNLSVPGRQRGEWGFVKPLIRRAMLESSGTRYRENLRLGEDYAFYSELLMAGARFVRIRSCGYVAVERHDSLSGKHRVEDLDELVGFDRGMMGHPAIDADAYRQLRSHLAQVEARHHHRLVLEARRAKGWPTALAATAHAPRKFPGLIRAVARDKFGRSRLDNREIRYLFA